MLMDILMEALMVMDDETLNGVLESCDAEELEIIDSAIEARYEDGPTTVTDKKQMKADYIKRKADSKRSSSPAKYDLEAKLVKNLRGHSTARSIGMFNRAIDKKESFTPEQAKYSKEFNKKNEVNAIKKLNKLDGGHVASTLPGMNFVYPPHEFNKIQAKHEYPDNKAKQTERVRELTKMTNNRMATMARNLHTK